jgi:hypothetical protein
MSGLLCQPVTDALEFMDDDMSMPVTIAVKHYNSGRYSCFPRQFRGIYR